MKKACALYMGIMILLFLLLGIVGSGMIRNVYQIQPDMISNLAGALFMENSAKEADSDGTEAGSVNTDGIQVNIADFLSGLRETTPERIAKGRDLLAGYGYSENWLFTVQGSYAQTTRRFWSLLTAFFVLFAGAGIIYFAQNERRSQKQLTELRNLLIMSQREDYTFAEEEKALSGLYDPLFADSVVKLGKNLELKTRQLAEEKDQTKTLVTDISHQLKTPVSALKTCFAMSMESEGEEKTRFLEACSRQIERVEQLMEALIQVARMEQGMIHVQPVEASLTDILVDAVNIVYQKAKKKEIWFDTISVEGQEYMVTADPKWSAEAIANILDNAVKYSPEGSRIQIRVQKLNSFIEIEIEDEGIGIPKEEQTLIFGRFYRGKSPYIKKQDGWGVGLYLSRKILEEENGALFMRQSREHGSIFIMHLPYPRN